ncbi:tetratricopeptide repeat protein [uncultured Bacteroides sp.]|uniref:tetratricopeptide repeat protein n=1 Tax=uncultured Bacteroides sp. TaxID=162156 RepID=UPI002638144D|nr:tetratricopeptide repeat protein [uncultured Bacteroides sp.]
MKKVLFSMCLLLAAGFTFAQEKAVKEAKSIANGTNPDFAKAEQLIQGALTNPETKDDPATWDVAGFIQRRRSEKEMENAFLRKPYDTLQVYNSALNMCKYFLKCDELAQIPNEKGKIKNKYRKSNAATMMGERGNLINGGIQYFNMATSKTDQEAKDLNAKALDFFATYIDVAASPMLEKENLLQTDTVLPQIAYYASLAAAKNEDYPNVLKYAPYAKNDKEVGKYAMEFISTALKAQGDTVKWIASLQEGIQKYPDHAFFFGHLIDYYSSNNKYDEAMQFADNMLAKDPNNTFYLYVKGYLYHNMYSVLKEQNKAQEAADALNKSIEFYQKTTEVDPNYAEAYSNLGLVYCLQAQDFSENATTDVNDPKYKEDQATLKTFYEKAKPCYEKARALKPDQKDLWLNGLYRVYYNLDMGPEFKEIEDMMQ